MTYLEVLGAHWAFIWLILLEPKPNNVVLILWMEVNINETFSLRDVVYKIMSPLDPTTHTTMYRILTIFTPWTSNYPFVIVGFHNSRRFLHRNDSNKGMKTRKAEN